MAAIVLSDPILEVARRELRRAFPDVRIDTAELREALTQEVLKREVTEGDKADEARKKLARAQGRALKAKSKAASVGMPEESEPERGDGRPPSIISEGD